jgi:uncharacterized protein YcfJ
MKPIILALATAIFVATASAQTLIPPQIEIATVVSRTPRIVTEYQRVCQQQYVERRDPSGSIIGGVIGGVIGNQFGKGSGNDIATGIGAIAGAIVGGNESPTVGESKTVCNNVAVQVQRGEIITFDYRGRRFVQIFQ